MSAVFVGIWIDECQMLSADGKNFTFNTQHITTHRTLSESFNQFEDMIKILKVDWNMNFLIQTYCVTAMFEMFEWKMERKRAHRSTIPDNSEQKPFHSICVANVARQFSAINI